MPKAKLSNNQKINMNRMRWKQVHPITKMVTKLKVQKEGKETYSNIWILNFRKRLKPI